MKILVVDDHPLILDALAQLLPQLGNDITVRTAPDRDTATRILDDEPDVALVLLDLALPGTRGLDVLADLMLDYPGVPVVVLSATHDPGTVRAALAAGARGYIPKTANAPVLLDALQRILRGDRYVAGEPGNGAQGDGAHIDPDALGLTARQSDVLRLLVQGKPNKLICRDLHLSEGTVKVHVSAILRTLHVGSRTQAIAELARRGISVETLSSHPLTAHR
ncbi:MAG: response regulator transcription factor [Betaproteobacteria bacterium]